MRAPEKLLYYHKQGRFLRSTEFVTGFVGGRGTGKSWIGAYKVLTNARAGETWMAAAPTYTMLDDATIPAFLEVARQTRAFIRIRGGSKPMAWFRTADGGRAQIKFRSADNPERMRGPSIPGLWLDEASLMQHDAFRLGIAMLRYKGRMGQCLITMTPKGRRQWTFETFYKEVPAEKVDMDRRTFLGGIAGALTEIAGRWYKARKNTNLVLAHTLENPFLPPEYYGLIRGNYTSALAAQELGGEFVDLEGLIFQAGWFEYVDSAPRYASRVRYWDRAATPGSGKQSAGLLMAMDPGGTFFIEDIVCGQWSAAERNRIMAETARKDARKYNNEVMIYAEQEGGSAGKEISEQYVRQLVGFPVYIDIVSGKRHRIIDKVEMPGEAKVIRAQPLAAQCEAGNVKIVRGPWNTEDFMVELTGFPLYKFSDRVDAASGAFNKLVNFGNTDPGEVSRPEVEADTSQFGLTLVRSRQRRRGL